MNIFQINYEIFVTRKKAGQLTSFVIIRTIYSVYLEINCIARAYAEVYISTIYLVCVGIGRRLPYYYNRIERP